MFTNKELEYKHSIGEMEQFTLRNPNTKKLHVCHCGCNVFTQNTDRELYECNRCHTLWEAH